jgi:hypothetical protein
MQNDQSTLSAQRTVGSDQAFTDRLPMLLPPLIGRELDIQAVSMLLRGQTYAC